MQNTLIVIVGPTAIGKTELAIKLANYLKTEIVSADSRQFYKEMVIGTAKPSIEELALAKHYFINSHSINDTFTVGDYEKAALKVITDIFKVNEYAILVGGSGLFINAVYNGFDELPKPNPGVREKLNQQFLDHGIDFLKKELLEVDAEYYNLVDVQNPHRIIRALEVFRSTGKPFSSFLNFEKKQRPFRIIKIGLTTSRQILYDRINQRVDKMISSGLYQEVESLFINKELNALNTVGYSELFKAISNELTLPEAINLIKQNTRRFAKRQLTWFKKDEQITWFEPHQTSEIITYIALKTAKPER